LVAAAVPESQNPCDKAPCGRNAGRWLGLARAKGMPIGDEPAPGAIMCMSTAGCGHVAIVLGVSPETVTVADANWHCPEDGRVRVHQLGRSRGDILGYIFSRAPRPAPLPAPALTLAGAGVQAEVARALEEPEEEEPGA
jgi:hypothetical protein